MRLLSIGMVIILLSAPLFVLSDVSEVAKAKQGSPDGGGYVYTDGLEPEPVIEPDYYDVKLDQNAEGLDTSSYYALIKKDLGFNFQYYGSTYSSIYISSYGAMSFVETSSDSFRNYYNYRIPSSTSPRGLMAVYWSWDNCYTRDKDRLYILRTEIDGEKVFMVEWNTGQGAKYEALLYEGGMIKYQYSSGNSNPMGSYCTIGIEKPDGSTGVPYINYGYSSTPKFNTPFAVAFTRESMEVRAITLENGDESGDTIYAGSKPYVFTTDIYHSSSTDSVLSCTMILGSLYSQERVKMIYYHGNRTFLQLSGFQHATLLPDLSGTVERNNNELSVKFFVDFRIEYPSEEKRNVTSKASGRSAIPSVLDAGEIYKVENDIEWDPTSLKVKKVSGEEQNLKNGDYIAGGQSIMFTTFRVYYERSDVQPPPSIVSINITDNFGLKKVAYIPQGDSLSTTWTVVDQTAIMTFDFEVAGLTYKNLLSDPFSFTLKVDTNPPNEVDKQGVFIYQDELYGSSDPYIEDEDTYFDNDDSFFLKWNKITDGESGIGGYLVEIDGDQFDLKKFVESKNDGSSNMSVQIGDTYSEAVPEGIYKVKIRARDLVGNIGPAISTNLVIDRTGPDFQLIDPKSGEWKMSRTPKVTIRVSDLLSPVYGMSLFYQVSTNGGITWSEPTSMLYYGKDKDSVDIEIEPTLAEGKNNLIRVQGQDFAGSGLKFSEEFSVWIDQRTPDISMVEPAVDGNLTTIDWIKDVRTPLKIAIHDWKGAGVDPTRMSYRISVNDGKSFSADIPLDGFPVNNSHGFAEYTFMITKDWLEGEENLLVIDAYDLVGRNSTKVYRIRVDMTPEIEILSPGVNEDHYDNRSVSFEVEVSDPDGEDDIDIVWMSNLDGPIGFKSKVDVVLTAGDHIITLTVEDGVHIIKRSIPVKVLSSKVLDPAYRDSDRDGMNDSYEEFYGFDPLVDDSGEDPDDDGHTNLEEYYANTDPTIKSEFPGSDLASSSVSTEAVVILVIGILILAVFGVLFIREINKQPETPQLPPYPLQQQALPPQGPMQLPALPPAR